MMRFLLKILPYAIVLASSLVLTLVLTPIVRELNRKLGMVDRPDARRINTVPIPRGGGAALFLGVFVSYGIFILTTGRPWMGSCVGLHPLRMVALTSVIFVLGFLDDKFNLSAKLKLSGQIAVAVATWFWGGLGFHVLWPALPAWADGFLTVFWIVGAVNAFNLIDGLDGLASGLALVATLGMAGSLMLTGNGDMTIFHFAFIGGLLGFLRYNYNPASIFLGDSGSMMLGFLVSTLPLATQTPNSFLVSVGVPLLAMGVPIFDTFLAILRRSVRHLIVSRDKREASGEGDSVHVMGADRDHLHHRILRAVGLNQRKAAWILYLMAIFLVAVGLGGEYFESRAAGLWLFALTVALIVVFRDMSRVELFDLGRLLNAVVRDRDTSSRRRIARLTVLFFVVADLALLVVAFVVMGKVVGISFSARTFRIAIPIRVFATFFVLVLTRTYVTVWSRAQLSNFARLLFACVLGAVIGSIGICASPQISGVHVFEGTVVYSVTSFVLLVALRVVRPLVRDLFYAVDCTRLKGRKDVSRILVYGSGLRYRAFRRELVRSTSANDRMIVGILDDDLLLRGMYVGGLKIWGSLQEAPEIINRLNVDAVVIACEIDESWRKVVLETLAPTGVRISHFGFTEKEVVDDGIRKG